MRVLPILVLLVLAGVVAWWGMGSDDAATPVVPEEDTVPGTAAPAGLQGRGTEAEAPPAEPATDERAWTLEVRASKRVGYGNALPEWDDAQSDASFAGKRVRVELRRGSEARVLARGVLDAEGAARFDLPTLRALDPLARAASALHVVADGPGLHLLMPRDFISRMSEVAIDRVALPAELPEGEVALRLVLLAATGGIVTGEVVTADGEPAAMALVRTYGKQGAEASDTCTGPDGRFVVDVSKGGRFDLTVAAMDGTAWRVQDLQWSADASRDLGRIVLDDAETFAGRITYADGTPVVGLPMVGASRMRNMHVSYASPSLPCETYGNGRSTRTDAQGRWRMHLGLPGPHVFLSIHADVPGNARVREVVGLELEEERVRTDLRGVLEGQRVDFVTADEAGRPVPGVRIELRALDAASGRDRTRPHDADVAGRTDDQGRLTVWLTHGSRWQMDAVLEGARPVHRTFEIAAQGNRRTIEVPMTARPTGTTLLVRLVDPEGAVLSPAVLHIRTPSGAQLFGHRVDAQPLRFLVPGVEALRVAGRAIERAEHVRSRYRWLPVSVPVDVPPGAETTVTLRTTLAAHLEVTLRAAADVPREQLPWHAEVRLTHEGSGRTLEEILEGPGHAHVEGETRQSFEVVGAELEAGWWTVQLEEDGFQPVTRRVELVAGELGRVELFFQPLDR